MECAPLAAQCMEFCRHLESQGRAFKFSLTVGTNFAFTLDTREETTYSKEVRKKKLSPSSIRRNERRKKEFLDKKSLPSEMKTEAAEKKSELGEKKPEAAAKKPEVSVNRPEVSVKKPEDAEKKMETAVNKLEAVQKRSETVEKKPDSSKKKLSDKQVRELVRSCDECRNSSLPCARHRPLIL